MDTRPESGNPGYAGGDEVAYLDTSGAVAGGGDGSGDSAGAKPRRRRRTKTEIRETEGVREGVKEAATATVEGGRKRRSPATLLPLDALAPMIHTVSQIVASRRGAHWELSAEESSALSVALVTPTRHLPMPKKQVGIAYDVFQAVVIASALFLPRIQADRELAASQGRVSAQRNGVQPVQSGSNMTAEEYMRAVMNAPSGA